MLLKKIENTKESLVESYYDSSNVLKSIYHKATQDLDIVFKRGAVYRYRNVPPKTAEEFEKDSSQGKYLNNVLRKNHETSKIVNVNTLHLIEHIQRLKEQNN
tara:strand:- start:911 stop:1216 length:306 start_codon:yes stop_codon:yes gene_type:complete